MSAICLFGALCAVNQSLLQSNIDLFDPSSSDVNSTYITNVQSPSESPCPTIFRYIKEAGEWHGEMTIENVDLQEDINLRLELTVDNKLVGKNDGALYLTYDKESKNNQTLIYKVDFPTQNPVPKVHEIYYNEQLICSGPEGTGKLPTLKLINILKPGQSIIRTNDHSYNESQLSVIIKRAINKRSEPNLNNDMECGVSMVGTTQSLSVDPTMEVSGLSLGGEEIQHGEWPWLVAYYYKETFYCGGNLISNRLVITAAHCIQTKNERNIHNPKYSFVYLGKHDLTYINEIGNKKIGVKRFLVHPEWSSFDKSYDADIAIIDMDSPVEYSDYIRPICVWNDELSSVIGREGSVGGWGKNENGEINYEYPKMIKVKIIDDEVCFENSSALKNASSKRTFCAAGGKYDAPCKGDSGGGLIFKEQGKWYLRGLVSAANFVCIAGSSAIFTDIAKFIGFIQFKTSTCDCGTRVAGITQSLSVGGEKSIHGEWPWLVAFYHKNRFTCGGNLISNRLIITAAQCIQEKQVSIMSEPKYSFVYLGKHDLNDLNEPGYEKRGVERFIVHPKWNPFDKSHDADIAIIVMDSPVEYSDYIRPICVWNDELSSVIGREGSFGGWGINENGVLNSEYPKMSEVQVISDGDCYRNFSVLAEISSDRTFCASGVKYDALCLGDGGGGLIFKEQDKWYLRGLFSALENSKCVAGSTAIFTDIAKFVSWISSVFVI